MRRRTARTKLPITLLVAALGVSCVSVVADPLPAVAPGTCFHIGDGPLQCPGEHLSRANL